MKRIKGIFLGLFAFLFVFSLASCSSNNDYEKKPYEEGFELKVYEEFYKLFDNENSVIDLIEDDEVVGDSNFFAIKANITGAIAKMKEKYNDVEFEKFDLTFKIQNAETEKVYYKIIDDYFIDLNGNHYYTGSGRVHSNYQKNYIYFHNCDEAYVTQGSIVEKGETQRVYIQDINLRGYCGEESKQMLILNPEDANGFTFKLQWK